MPLRTPTVLHACVLGLLVACGACADAPERFDRAHLVAPRLDAATGVLIGAGEGGADDRTLPSLGVDLEDGLSPDEAVAIALHREPRFQAVLATLERARAALVAAGELPNPSLSVLAPVGPKQLEFTLTFPLEVLWLRGQRVSIAEEECERIAEDIVTAGLDLARDVRVAWADARLAGDRAAVAREVAEIADREAKLVAARERAGDASELEASRAALRAADAEREARRSELDATAARLSLAASLGLAPEDAAIEFEDPPAPVSAEEIPSAEALGEEAQAWRPDVRSAALAAEAARERADMTTGEFLAASLLVDANEKGASGFEIGPGLSGRLPIFHWNAGARSAAHAEIEISLRRLVAVRHAVRAEVHEAHARFLAARLAVRHAEETLLPRSAEVSRTVSAAEAKGAATLFDILGAARDAARAHGLVAESRAELLRSRARLERAIGHRLDSFPSPSDRRR